MNKPFGLYDDKVEKITVIKRVYTIKTKKIFMIWLKSNHCILMLTIRNESKDDDKMFHNKDRISFEIHNLTLNKKELLGNKPSILTYRTRSF